MPSLRISLEEGPPEIRAAVAAMSVATRDIRSEVNKRLRAEMNPVWKGELEKRIHDKPRRLLLKGARIKAGNPPELIAANGTRRFGRGLIPREHWRLAEFGVIRDKTLTYERRNRTSPGTHKVTRRALNYWSPYRKAGRVIFPTVAAIGPRLTALFVQTVARTFMDASEKGR